MGAVFVEDVWECADGDDDHEEDNNNNLGFNNYTNNDNDNNTNNDNNIFNMKLIMLMLTMVCFINDSINLMRGERVVASFVRLSERGVLTHVAAGKGWLLFIWQL